MPFAHPSEYNNTDNQTHSSTVTIGNGRYTLRRCMAETALGKLWWSQDQQQQDGENGNVLVFTILPALAQNTVFEQALRQVLPSYQKNVPYQPHITDNGKEADGTRWLVIQNIRGMLLVERMQELDDRGMPQAQAVSILEQLSEAISHQRPEGVFGFLEPGAILIGENGCRLLNAPAAAALRLATNGIISYTGRHLSFQSGFISPEVALGDPPTPADDTFSLACIAYNLLQGSSPFGLQTTLEAAVRNAAPASIKKLRPEAWAALQQGISLKRNVRQTTPTTMIAALKPKRRTRLPMLAAGLTIASFVAYGSYHLLSGFTHEEKHPAELQLDQSAAVSQGQTTSGETTAMSGEKPTPEPAQPREESAATTAQEAEAQAKAAAAEAANTEARQQEISKLLKSAENAIQEGKLLSNSKDDDSATTYLNKVRELDSENAELKRLATSMVDKQQNEAATLLESGAYDAARESLSTADKLITEFALTNSLQRQVQLEAQADQNNRDQEKLKEYIASARKAIDYGNLVEGDDRSESAIAYLNTLMDEYPNNPEGKKLLKEVVRNQQDEALSAMRKNNAEDARKLLDGSQLLIAKYMLDNMVEQQLTLEKRYRDTEHMGIFPSGQEPDSNAEQNAENKSRPESTPTASTVIPPAHTRPVEVTVPPDVPVTQAFPPVGSAAPVSNNLPPVQINIPMVPPPAPVYEIPAVPNNNTGNSFTPDVPGLMEVPLDTIDESLPPAR